MVFKGVRDNCMYSQDLVLLNTVVSTASAKANKAFYKILSINTIGCQLYTTRVC